MASGTHKTKVSTQDGYTSVRYHSTDVVRFSASTIYLNTGGYRSNTTRLRMNQAANQFALGYIISQRNFAWFVCTNAGDFPYNDREMCIDRNTGRPCTQGDDLDLPKEV